MKNTELKQSNLPSIYFQDIYNLKNLKNNYFIGLIKRFMVNI